MNVTLTKVYRNDKDKEGKPLINKNDKAYTRVSIKTQEHGEKWLSGFSGPNNENWNEGDSVDIEVTQRGEYLNFKAISASDNLWLTIREIESRISALEGGQMHEDEEDVNKKLEEAGVDPEGLPF